MPAVPEARLADGRLDLLTAPATSAARHARHAAEAAPAAAISASRRSATHSLQTLTIDSDDAIPLAADGEPLAACATLRDAGCGRQRFRSSRAPAAPHSALAVAPPRATPPIAARSERQSLARRIAVDRQAREVDLAARARRSGRPSRGRCRPPSSSRACRGRSRARGCGHGVRADDRRAVGRHRAQAAPELGRGHIAAGREQVGHDVFERVPARLVQLAACSRRARPCRRRGCGRPGA